MVVKWTCCGWKQTPEAGAMAGIKVHVVVRLVGDGRRFWSVRFGLDGSDLSWKKIAPLAPYALCFGTGNRYVEQVCDWPVWTICRQCALASTKWAGAMALTLTFNIGHSSIL